MLNVILLKGMHSGREQARKLLPYVQKANVYSPEQAACTEQYARELEADWERVSWSISSKILFDLGLSILLGKHKWNII